MHSQLRKSVPTSLQDQVARSVIAQAPNEPMLPTAPAARRQTGQPFGGRR